MLLSQVADEGVAFFADGVAGISHASALNHAAPLDAAVGARRLMLMLAYSSIGRELAIRPCCASRTRLDGLMHHWRATKQRLHSVRAHAQRCSTCTTVCLHAGDRALTQLKFLH
ncbi:hypothetical protein [Xanthomonas campestris]|uniref:hypothetical protein n=1 Tax=Xanthomonas campestris TaxID=339 RepID=UPI0011C07F1C|nr:hypothetical protein [Xanthomonas campestris]MEA9490160.1 hypothetical protein [Xanthomonas campestris]MEA9509129.1 hypothetical protein [Xanthomonas campestris]MEA9575447.1 hypothetical protein [Xanthomonas campestris]MEA9731993.1 hypothetical protein [Xanthomonas campestris]MEB2112458.1 hypothetical protein [Xanthomonas campestris pv. campestris]